MYCKIDPSSLDRNVEVLLSCQMEQLPMFSQQTSMWQRSQLLETRSQKQMVQQDWIHIHSALSKIQFIENTILGMCTEFQQQFIIKITVRKAFSQFQKVFHLGRYFIFLFFANTVRPGTFDSCSQYSPRRNSHT